MALIGLKRRSVTPTVKVVGTGGGGGGGGGAAASVMPSVAATGFGGTAALGGALAATTTVYLFSSRRYFRNSTLSGETFFSTIAHLIPFSSSDSWFLLMAMTKTLNLVNEYNRIQN